MPAVRVHVSLGVVTSEGATELVRLRDGSSVTVRAATARDEPALLSFLNGLCLEARRMRFFTGAADIPYAAHLAAATGADRYGLIAHDEAGLTVAHATYVKLDEQRAEVAVEVADHLHGRGLGTTLIERLAAVAEARGITSFVAEVLPDNSAMLDVFRDGFDAQLHFHDGTDTAEFPTAAWRLAHERFAQTPDDLAQTPDGSAKTPDGGLSLSDVDAGPRAS
jgi:GNAT superfamily N-acetyltransferase